MQRDGSDMDGNRQQRPQSPGSAEGAPSPSKRPRLENAPFNAAQGMMPNGRGQGIPGQQGAGPAGNVAPNAQMLLANGINPGNLTAQQFQNFPGQAQGPKALQQYNNNLAQHQQSQMPNKGMPNPNGPQGQGSPMMPNQEGTIVAGYYNAERPNVGPNNGSHALQDYQMQLMLLEQQNKKRLLMARQEQDGLSNRDGSGGPGGPGPNGQAFQGTSPQGARSVNSPNPNDMNRGTPQMNTTGVPSPVPEGQSRGSPGSMGFMPGNIDPNMTPHFYGKVNGMEGGMIGGVPNVMRPPSSHPTAFNANGQPNQQQMMNMQRQQQQQQQQGNVNQQQVPGWPAGPNGTPMMQQASQPGAPTPQPVGTPQQRAMPPPSAPAVAPAVAQAANGRTQTSSPQQPAAPPTPSQTTKANPKAKKDTKPKVNKPYFTTFLTYVMIYYIDANTLPAKHKEGTRPRRRNTRRRRYHGSRNAYTRDADHAHARPELHQERATATAKQRASERRACSARRHAASRDIAAATARASPKRRPVLDG